MRSKRTIKPTRFFDNSVVNTSRNSNKQKNTPKKNVDKIDKENGTVEYDEESVSVNSNQSNTIGEERIDGNVDVSSEEEIREKFKEVNVVNGGRNDVEVQVHQMQDTDPGEVIGDKTDVVFEPELVKDNGVTSNDMATKEQKESNQTNSNKVQRTYANVGVEKLDLSRKLVAKPTEMDEEGNEFAIFNDVILSEGCKKWDMIVCGYFVRHNMTVNELRYNLRKMWGRKGFKDIIDVNNGVYFMRFYNEEGMDSVVNSGPWMVNNKPFFVQKWDIHVCLDRREPKQVPLWIRLCNVPLEAWTTNGISALASRLGNPLVMDNTTAEMCKMGVGRVGYARVLVEVSAYKCLPEEIEKKPDSGYGNDETKNKDTTKMDEDGFTQVRSRKYNGNGDKNSNNQTQNFGLHGQMKNPVTQFMYQKKNKDETKMDKQCFKNDARKKSTNKFTVLNELDDHEEGVDPNTEKQNYVNDVFPDNNGIEKGMESDNIEGLGTSDKQNEVKKFIGGEKLSICAIIETRIKTKKIILGWDSDIIRLNLISYCKQSMLCKVDAVKGSLSMFYTFMYAANRGNERLELWKELVMYKKVIGNNVWAIMGDMNVTLDPKEHLAGKSYMSKDMYDFKECVNLIEVEDITSSGLFYTWIKNLYKTKNGDDAGILKKLDRVIGNETFILKAKKKSFRFANFYLKELAWKDGDIFENVKELRIKLKEVQTKIDKDPTNKVLIAEESKILHEYNNAMSDEEKFLYQKAKVKWLFVGDRNNAYFHKALKSRNHRNRINAIHDEEGKRYECNEVGKQFVNHFKKFSGESIPVRKFLDIDELFKVKLSQDEALSMIHNVSDAEIKRAMFQINDNNAPGPDGFSSHFYKKAWDTIIGDICKAVKDLFHKGEILSEINSTVIALVPKIQTPAKVSDYRPIACCNVIFKCISKILTERIKMSLKKLVSQNQSAFIPSRQIQDNILISQELLKMYERKGGPKRVALKIDLQKAYDTINWCFMANILKGFRFYDKMVQWIMLYVTTTTFSINVNDESCGYFKGGRGLRQGDPISPYLFILVMEVLNLLMIRNIVKNGSFNYHFGCGQLSITHVCFADDLLMFCHGDVASVKVIKETIKEFGTVSLVFSQITTKVLSYLEGLMRKADKEERANALIIKHLWHVAIDKDSLWVKWVNTFKLKGRSIWEINEELYDSWGWRNILRIRKDVRQYIVTKIGNGDNTSLWFDNWAGIGALSDFVSYRDIYDVRMKANLTVSEFIKGYNGKDGTMGEFFVSQAYYDLQTYSNAVSWNKLVWFSENIPKHAFILWLVIQEKLTTQDKVRRWGSYDMMVCLLCYDEMDSHKHLFFKCEFANKFWRMVKRKIKFHCADMEWQDLITKLSGMQNGNSVGSIVRRLCLATCVYLVWQERNNKIFRDEARSIDNLFTIFNNIIQWRLSSLKVKKSQAVLSTAEIWDIKFNVIYGQD
ncbi:RNA-directed DNA polymerase, eukaryota, reverse transcriptase zinc-binding domain protein [Tanacetum coccineum]